MLAVVYLIISFCVGWVLKQIFQIDAINLFYKITGRTNKLPPAWVFDFPFSLIVGTTFLTTLHYYLTFMLAKILPININPVYATDIFLIPILAIFFLVSYHKVLKKKHQYKFHDYFSSRDLFYWKALWSFLLFAIFLIFYSFFVYNSSLRSGFTVFGDFAPHTALINSFAKGFNFPTGYPHFSGDGIKYHFFFFYLCGILQSLGFRIDFAMNIPSVLGILCFTTLLGGLGVCLAKRKWIFFLAPFMLFFRSSYAIFSYLQELLSKNGVTFFSLINDIIKTNKFIGNTLRDDWGLWTMNVYANQRHFLWGFSILLLILFIFLPSVTENFFKTKKELSVTENSKSENLINDTINDAVKEKNINHDSKENIKESEIVKNPTTISVFHKLKFYFSSPAFWKISNVKELVLCALLIVCLPYWHGSMLISILCILFTMAFFARNRLSFIIIAILGFCSSLMQSLIFAGSSSDIASPKFLWGFISENKSFTGVFNYLFQVVGVALIFIIILPFIHKKRVNRVFLIAAISPIIFAFCISLTPDVTVNHKYIIISLGLLNIFIADALCIIGELVKSTFLDMKISTSKQDRIYTLKYGNRSPNSTPLFKNFNNILNVKIKTGSETIDTRIARNRDGDLNTISDTDSNTALISETNPDSKININKNVPMFKNRFIVFNFSKKLLTFFISVVIFVFISFSLLATGFVEMIGYINKNVNTVGIDLNSPITKWIEQNTSPEDVFLTAPYHINEFFFSGRKVFYGWAYYSWSAGYDTLTREKLVRKMFSGYDGDIKGFIEIAKQNHIRYVIIDDNLKQEKDYNLDEKFFINNFNLTISFPGIHNTSIFKLY